MNKGIIISCFDKTTNMVKPWAENGYLCYCIDIQHKKGICQEGNIVKVGTDILSWSPLNIKVKIAFFFPPCTNLAVSGARWFKAKGLKGLIRALTLFDRAIELAEYFQAPYMIENPVSTVSTYWRKPDYVFQPWQYGDMYNKKTCLWVGKGFCVPQPIITEKPEGVTDKIHRMTPSKYRSDKRSETPMGFALAVYKTNV